MRKTEILDQDFVNNSILKNKVTEAFKSRMIGDIIQVYGNISTGTEPLWLSINHITIKLCIDSENIRTSLAKPCSPTTSASPRGSHNS